MLMKAIMSQTTDLLKRKEAVCVFYVLLAMVMVNFIGNVMYFQSRDIVHMYQPMKLLLLSYNRINWNATNTLMFIQLYPLLVVCPAGFSLAREYQSGTRVFLISRMGNLKYQISKYLSAFLATTIIFTVPFLLEILLNCVSFPMSAIGDLSNLSTYSDVYLEGVDRYLLKWIYRCSPYLYTVIGTLLWGFISGLLGLFSVAVSSIIRFKYNVFLFLPVFCVLNLSTVLKGNFLKGIFSIKWYDYMLLFNDEYKSTGFWFIVLAVLVLFPTVSVCVNRRKDCL